MLYNVPDTLTVKEVQQILHRGKNFVLALIKDGILEAHKIGNRWIILKEDLEEYILHS